MIKAFFVIKYCLENDNITAKLIKSQEQMEPAKKVPQSTVAYFFPRSFAVV